MKDVFDNIALKSSKITTHKYSTSFGMGIRFLHRNLQSPIYSIYGFVRFADEIVDTFHDYNKEELFERFKADTYHALEHKISLNPILNSFQNAVHEYNIDRKHIDTFLKSMEMDLYKSDYDSDQYQEYIVGSAEVVGLMCLKVFVGGNQEKYDELEHYAMKLGAAFQKINFLRDLKEDYVELGRSYFPEIDFDSFNDSEKRELEKNIARDFEKGFEGIRKLPKKSRFGVYLAYVYYINLFHKIKKVSAEELKGKRVRIPNNMKYRLLMSCYLRNSFNML